MVMHQKWKLYTYFYIILVSTDSQCSDNDFTNADTMLLLMVAATFEANKSYLLVLDTCMVNSCKVKNQLDWGWVEEKTFGTSFFPKGTVNHIHNIAHHG